jgi:exopolyphosphatase/guanosine-5'-triphosphate,3'-diphosphate pyrophosphatase
MLVGEYRVSLFLKNSNLRSFKAGTVRLLNEMVCDVVWDEIEKWISKYEAIMKKLPDGSGGNINKLFKMSGTGQEKPLSYIYMTSQYSFLNSFHEQRIAELGLNPDRADVIIPATRNLNAMKWSGARQIYVPKIDYLMES